MLAEGILSRKKEITKDNSIPAFKQALRLLVMESDEEEHFDSAVKDMTKVIHSLIRDSMGDKNYDQALENIGVMREQLIGLEVPGLYNNFLRDLKTKLKSGSLGGERRDLWIKIQYPGKLGLIHKNQSECSDLTEEEARKVRATPEYCFIAYQLTLIPTVSGPVVFCDLRVRCLLSGFTNMYKAGLVKSRTSTISISKAERDCMAFYIKKGVLVSQSYTCLYMSTNDNKIPCIYDTLGFTVL